MAEEQKKGGIGDDLWQKLVDMGKISSDLFSSKSQQSTTQQAPISDAEWSAAMRPVPAGRDFVAGPTYSSQNDPNYQKAEGILPSVKNSQNSGDPYFLKPVYPQTVDQSTNDPNAQIELSGDAVRKAKQEEEIRKIAEQAQLAKLQKDAEKQRKDFQSGMYGAIGNMGKDRKMIEDASKQQANIANEYTNLAKQTADDLKIRADNMAAEEESNDKLLGEHEKSINDAMARVENFEIDPSRYWSKAKKDGKWVEKDDRQFVQDKITAGIAIVLGGIGQGLMKTGNNQALDIINNAVKTDIEAQKASFEGAKSAVDAKMNLYSAAFARVKDKRMAKELATNMGLRGVQMQIDALAARSNSAEVKARAGAAMAQIDNQIMENRAKMAQMFMQSPMAAQQQGELGVIRAVLPEKMQGKAIEDLDKIKSARENASVVMSTFEDMVKNQKEGIIGSGGQYWTRRNAGLSQQKLALKPIIGAVTAADEATLDGLAPTYFDNAKTIQEKREGLKRFLDSIMPQSTLLNAAGIQPGGPKAPPLETLKKETPKK